MKRKVSGGSSFRHHDDYNDDNVQKEKRKEKRNGCCLLHVRATCANVFLLLFSVCKSTLNIYTILHRTASVWTEIFFSCSKIDWTYCVCVMWNRYQKAPDSKPNPQPALTIANRLQFEIKILTNQCKSEHVLVRQCSIFNLKDTYTLFECSECDNIRA